MYRTITQNKQLHGLLAKLQIGADIKANMILQFTQGRTDKSSEMSVDECKFMIGALNRQWQDMKGQKSAKRQYNGIEQDLRRKVFKLFYDIGFISSSDNTQRKLFVINSWIGKKTQFEKTLNELNETELNSCIKQLYTVRRIYEERQKKQAQWN